MSSKDPPSWRRWRLKVAMTMLLKAGGFLPLIQDITESFRPTVVWMTLWGVLF
jgi:hypothetical protein